MMTRMTSMLTLLVAGAAVAAPPPIDRVVVFGDRAQVTRIKTVDCNGGNARAEFFPLPESLDERTVRAEASGKALAVGTSLSKRPLEADRDEKVEAARAKLREIDVRIAALQATQRRRNARGTTIGGFEDYAEAVLSEQMRDGADLKGWGQTFDRIRAERLRLTEANQTTALTLRAALRERSRQAKTVSLLDPRKAEHGRAVEVAVDCRGAAKATVRLAYVVPGATWQPEYDLRATPKNAKALTGAARVELGTSAVIRQSTGEDWTNAQVVLSSARPWLGVQAPEPRMLKLYARKAGKQKVLVSATEKRDTLKTGKARAPSGATSANVSDAGTAVTLTLPKRITIASDGRPYWVPIDSKVARGEVALVALPGLAAAIWQVARLDNPAGYPLLAGTVHAYRRGTYMGADALEHHGPGAPMEVSLGLDGQLRLERAPITDKEKIEGIFGSTRKLARAYEIVLKNGHSTAATIDVRELLPVSKNAEIEVDIVAKGTTKGYTVDKERGIVSWTVTVPAGGEQRIDYAYTIALPEDWKMRN